MTFSLIGRCAKTGMFGVVVTSSSVCVTSRCAWARAGVGAVATQNVTDPRLGKLGLDLLQQGHGAASAMAQMVAAGRFAEYRQLTIVDGDGAVAHHSGSKTLGRNKVATGGGCVAAGNLLRSQDVPERMVQAFLAALDDHMGERLLRAVEAGLAAGGEEGPVRSAGLIVVDRWPWPIADLRVDWHEEPITELRRIWEIYRPQMADYLTRALDPPAAPSYGVPGDR
ncbi:MAG TPA: DUF1028 domain-containing protein [Alphaproteobacteria bacterium]|nr:DUF1028 domain-containing protein [Alphaproteobacteria bacterium]